MVLIRLGTRSLALLALVGAAMGCSDDGDDSGSSGASPDAALARQECYLGLQVPGVTHDGYACSGSESSSSLSGLVPEGFDAALNIYLTLAAPPAIGALELTSLAVEIPEGDVVNRWESPVDSCTATATDSSTDEEFDWKYYLIDISCSQPAEPVSPNTEPPLELGSFSIVTFFTIE